MHAEGAWPSFPSSSLPYRMDLGEGALQCPAYHSPSDGLIAYFRHSGPQPLGYCIRPLVLGHVLLPSGNDITPTPLGSCGEEMQTAGAKEKENSTSLTSLFL